jgi:hypothetical protein
VSEISLTLTDEAREAIAERAAEIVLERLQAPADDGWLRGAKRIAEYIGASEGRVKELSSLGRIPLERDGRGLVAKRSELDAWIRAGGGKRP